MCLQFLKQNSNGIIVSLGAGLDNRFVRIDNNRCIFIEIDYLTLIDFKKQLIIESPRYIFIGKSVLDFSWINQVKTISNSNELSVFFIAEGLIPYFDKPEIQMLFKNLIEVFPNSEIFFDVCGERAVKMMSKHSGIQEWEVELKSGFKSGSDIEDWDIGFKFLEDWCYPNDPDAKKGMMKLMWILPMFKYWLFFIHGRFIKSSHL